MKFDFVIGNPPYQEEDGGAKASAKPVYQYFVEEAKKIAKNSIEMIIPARWYAGGKGLDDFRNEMLNDKNIKIIHDFPNTNDCFPNQNIRGGVCIFIRNEDYDNTKKLAKVVTHINGKEIVINRPIKYKDVDIFIRYGQAIHILEKVINNNSNDMTSKIVSSRKPFGLSTDFIESKNFHKDKSNLKNPVICYARGKSIGYVERNLITIHKEWIDKIKIFIPRANNIGTELNDDNLNSFIAYPNTICTESYLVVGAEMNLDEITANNLSNYLKTKFVRFLHSIAKSSQDATSKTWAFVPLQDFTDKSDIDWTKPISDIDRQLYKKYNLSQDEIDFIETNVKEMI